MPSSPARPRSVGEIESFVTLLRAACHDATMNARLQRILELPDEKRRSLIHSLVSDMLIAKAPRDFVMAIACLEDDAVAEKAYEVIFQCGANPS